MIDITRNRGEKEVGGGGGGGREIRDHDFDRNGHVVRTWVSFMKVARRSRRWRQLW